jgi:hypothetical protein
MANAPQAKPPVPAELPYGAQTQKTLGKAKRAPDDQAEYFYNKRKMHILFFLSSAALLISCVLMFWDDYAGATAFYNRDWKHFQRAYEHLDFGKLQDEIRVLKEQLDGISGRLGAYDREIKKLESTLPDPKTSSTVTIRVLETRLDSLTAEAQAHGWKFETLPADAEDKLRRRVPVRAAAILPRGPPRRGPGRGRRAPLPRKGDRLSRPRRPLRLRP